VNTNDFYKQLMSEYTFDHEKIKKAAMGKAAPKQKKNGISPAKWIAYSAAAAAVTAAVGVVTLMGGIGNPITITPNDSMSAEERIYHAMEAFRQSEEKTEEVFLYVTFKKAETPDDMQKILSSASNTGDIKVVTVYLSDNTAVTGSANIQQLFDYSEENITAVKIRCPGNLFKNILKQNEVYLVENGDDFDEESFSVIDTNYEYDYNDYEPSTPEPPVQQTETSMPEDTSSVPPQIGDSKESL